WNDLSETVSQKWDTVLDAIDGLVTAPDVDEKVLEQTAEELAAFHEESAEAEAGAEGEEDLEAIDSLDSSDDEDEEDDAPVGFWAEVGIDPVKIIASGAEY